MEGNAKHEQELKKVIRIDGGEKFAAVGTAQYLALLDHYRRKHGLEIWAYLHFGLWHRFCVGRRIT